MSAQTYQEGAHFAAIIEKILMSPFKTIERFFCISSSSAGLWYITRLLWAPNQRPQPYFQFQLNLSAGMVENGYWCIITFSSNLLFQPPCLETPMSTPLTAWSTLSTARENILWSELTLQGQFKRSRISANFYLDSNVRSDIFQSNRSNGSFFATQ